MEFCVCRVLNDICVHFYFTNIFNLISFFKKTNVIFLMSILALSFLKESTTRNYLMIFIIILMVLSSFVYIFYRKSYRKIMEIIALGLAMVFMVFFFLAVIKVSGYLTIMTAILSALTITLTLKFSTVKVNFN